MGVITKVHWRHDATAPANTVLSNVPDPDAYGITITADTTAEISNIHATDFYEGTLLVDQQTNLMYVQKNGAWSGIGGSGGGGTAGPPGPAGPTGPAGATGPAGPGVAAGGLPPQILSKKSTNDYDTIWIDPPVSGDEVFIGPNAPSLTQYELWVDEDASPIQPAIGTATLVGEMKMWPGAATPLMYLPCDGRTVSRITYSVLYAALGTAWGAGDGSTTFALPDMRGRAPIGVGQGAGLTNRALAAQVGVETVTLDLTMIPIHGHDMSHGHADQWTSNENNNHTHGIGFQSGGQSADHLHYFSGGARYVVAQDFSGGGSQIATQPGSGNPTNLQTTDGTNVDHSHAINGNTGGISVNHQHISYTPAFNGNTGNAGSGAAHNNMQPSVAVNYIIYTGVP